MNTYQVQPSSVTGGAPDSTSSSSFPQTLHSTLTRITDPPPCRHDPPSSAAVRSQSPATGPQLPQCLSMRTTGRVVRHGCSRKCRGLIRLSRTVSWWSGCCTLVLHASGLTFKCQPAVRSGQQRLRCLLAAVRSVVPHQPPLRLLRLDPLHRWVPRTKVWPP